MASDYAPTPVDDFLDPDDPTFFPRLTPEQIEYLAEIGTQLTFARGDAVFEHGPRAGDGALVVRSIHASLASGRA